jgi:hypothetical protein
VLAGFPGKQAAPMQILGSESVREKHPGGGMGHGDHAQHRMLTVVPASARLVAASASRREIDGRASPDPAAAHAEGLEVSLTARTGVPGSSTPRRAPTRRG